MSLPKERAILVILNNPHSIAALRKWSERHLGKKTSEDMQAYESSNQVANKLTAVRQLKSGDVALYVATAKDAEQLVKRPKWLRSLGLTLG